MSLLTPSSSFMLDVVVVVPPSAALDDDGAPMWNESNSGTSFPASVQRSFSSGLSTRLQGYSDNLEVQGEGMFNILFASDPSVVVSGQKLVWTHHQGAALAAPVIFTSLGIGEPPGGLSNRWTVSCKFVAE